MRRPTSRRAKQSGVGFFLVVIIIVALMPLVLLMLKGSIFQNKNALRDRNIKTSREMAESIGIEYMNSFATDWHRDSFNILYTTHSTPSFAGLGEATSKLTVSRSSGTIRVETVARYNKGGAISPSAVATKGVDALFTFSSDYLKFDFVWPRPVIVGTNVSGNISRITPFQNTIFVNGDYDSTVGFSPIPNPMVISGFWVVRGNFRVRNKMRLSNLLVHCQSTDLLAGAISDITAIRRTFPASQFVPMIDAIPPEGNAPSPTLSYYNVRASTGFNNVVSGIPQGFILRLNSNDTFDLRQVNPDFSEYSAPAPTINYPYFTDTSLIIPATAPFILAIRSGNVRILNSVVSRPITLVHQGGGVTEVTGDIKYWGGATSADVTRSFALLTEGNLNLRLTGVGITTELHGFYGTVNGNIGIFKGATDDPSLQINGTLYGMILAYGLNSGIGKCNVRADPNLALFPPPLFPRRPRLIFWDYVP